MTKRFSVAAVVLLLFAMLYLAMASSSFRRPIAEAERCTENIKGACVSVNALPEKVLQLLQ